MKIHRGLGPVALVLLLGACEVEVNRPTSRPAPPPPRPAQVAGQHHPAAPPPRPAPPQVVLAPPPPQPHPIFIERVIHPAPLLNVQQSGTLDVARMRLRMKPGRRCGPHESSPGHWIHIDCNKYSLPRRVVAANPRKNNLMMEGKLLLYTSIKGALPSAVDHRNDGTEGPIKDQGQVGSCTAFSLSSAMDNGIRRQNRQDTTSSLHVWSHYGTPDMGAAGDGNVGKDIATWPQWPYDERLACELDTTGDCGPYSPPTGDPNSDSALQSKIKAADAEGNWIIREYDQIGSDPNSIATMLASGADVWFAMQIGDSWMSPNPDHTISDWTDDSIDGGHAVLFAGYRLVNGKRQFLVHNSWGTSWGDNGFAWISEAMVTAYLEGAYKVVVEARSGPNPAPPAPPGPPHLVIVIPTAPPQPSPPPAPTPTQPNPPTPPQPPTPPPPQPNPSQLTDDDCGANELVDSVTGQCAQMCPDDSRPANGQCPSTGGKRR